MSTRQILLVTISATLVGCGTSPLVTPHVMHPLEVARADTAIFVSADQRTSEPVLSTLAAVDGRRVNCDFNAGCPVWVRVPAGSREFTIKYRADFHGVPGLTNSGHKETELNATVPQMKPRHVYVARYTRSLSDNTVSIRVEDLGENSKFTLRFPLFGTTNPQYYPAEF
jgi:hypothetical protein